MFGRFNTADNFRYLNTNSSQSDFFVKKSSNHIVCRGIVVEIEHHEVFRSKFHKLINSLLCGEPYQFAHQTAEYLLRVEEPTRNGIGRTVDIFLYGNYMGRFYPGDEIEVTAKICRQRYVAEKIYNVSTHSQVNPGLQLPAIVIRGMTITALMILVGFGMWLYGIWSSGGLSIYIVYLGIVAAGLIWLKRWIKSIFK